MRHPIHKNRTLSLFDAQGRGEKGSSEWGAFNAVRDDRMSAYKVTEPNKVMVVKGERHILRIIAPRPRKLRGAH